MAERDGSPRPRVDRVVKAATPTLLVMEWVDGSSPGARPGHRRTVVRMWDAGGQLHRAASTNRVAAGREGCVRPEGLPRIVDFGFSELAPRTAADLEPGGGRIASWPH